MAGMEKILLKTRDAVSVIFVGARWEAVVKLLPPDNVVILTDSNVSDIYGHRFPEFPVIKIKPGEQSKQLKVTEALAKKLLRRGIDRSGFILAIGGGVVCDIAGFLASVYMRGIKCAYVSTTLLSQVDASTGGKTGVNLGEIKNIIGTFSQPEFVICDTTMLRTLPEEEYLSGLAELIKTGIIGDKEITEILENNFTAVIKRDRDLMSGLVARSIRYKASVVAQDEKESGLRRVLNFGHTFGHAIELHESLKHGLAVAEGMKMAVLFSLEKKLINVKECDRIISLLDRYNLLHGHNISPEKMEEFVSHDKKRSGAMIHFVFTEGIGKPLVKQVPVKEIVDFYRNYIRTN